MSRKEIVKRIHWAAQPQHSSSLQIFKGDYVYNVEHNSECSDHQKSYCVVIMLDFDHFHTNFGPADGVTATSWVNAGII